MVEMGRFLLPARAERDADSAPRASFLLYCFGLVSAGPTFVCLSALSWLGNGKQESRMDHGIGEAALEPD